MGDPEGMGDNMEGYDNEMRKYREGVLKHGKDRRGNKRRRLDVKQGSPWPPDVLTIGGILAVASIIYLALIGD